MEVTPEMIDCWRVNYCLDKTPHELHEFWGYRAPSGAVLAFKAGRWRGRCLPYVRFFVMLSAMRFLNVLRLRLCVRQK